MNNNSTVLVSTLQLRKWAFCLLSFLTVLPILAQKDGKGGDELDVRASELFEAGKFAEAYPLYSQLLSLKPNDPGYNFRFGATALYAGVPKETSLKHLNYALKKNCDDVRVWFYLGKAHHLNYDFTAAASAYRSYLDKLDPKEKNPLPAQRNLQMCEQGGKLLSNIRDVVVLEKTEAAESDFFRYYNLEEIGGRVLRTPDELLSKYDKKVGLISVMHYPGDATTIYFTSYGKDGSTGKDLYKADILPGGSYSTPERLPDGINTAEDEDFAFLHPDGKSFFFASRGHNSMGGYDIFRSEYSRMTDSFGPPVNLDFAINTPDDDLFYVVDSLKQTAYFASGRTSAQGALHVYKVLVESLPLKLMFIAGDYLPEAEGLDDQARLILTDELTGRTVAEATASASRGGYFLELPKSGSYRIEVQPKGSAVRHSGVFTVPNYDESVALKQELRIVNENGIERLIITNSFEDPLDVDLAQLAADALRRRSALDPNATDERIEAAREHGEKGSLREELTPETVVQAAGFTGNETLESVLAAADQRATDLQKQAERFEASAGTYLTQAAVAQQEANAKTEEARSVIAAAEGTEGAEYIAAVNRYNALLNEAEQASANAKNLLESAERLTEASTELKRASEQQVATNATIANLVETKNWSAAKDELGKLRTAAAAPTPNPAAVALKTALDEADRAALQADKRLESQTSEQEVLTLRIQQINRELAAASKKADKERLNEQLEQARAEERALVESTAAAQQKSIQLRKESQALRSQLKLIDAAESTALADAASVEPWTKERAEALRNQIASNEASLAELNTQPTEMASAVTDAETRRTFSVELLPTLAARSAEADIALIPLQERTASYTDKLSSIQANPSTAAYKQRALDQLQLAELNNHLAQLRELALSELPENERSVLELEIIATENSIADLNAALTASANTPDTSAGRQTLDQRFPDYAQLRTAEKGSDLEQTLRRVERAEAIEAKLRDEEQSLRLKLLESTSINEIDALEAELLGIENMRAVIQEDREPNRIQAAWENDRLAIIEEDENFESRIVRQIELTETYISTLERLEEDARTNGDIDQAKAYAERRNQAENKLNEQRSERELALSVSDNRTASVEQPSTELNQGVNSTLVESEATEASTSDNEDTADSAATENSAANVADQATETASTSRETTEASSADPAAQDERSAQIAQLQLQIDATTDEALRDQLLADISVLNTPLKEGELLVNAPAVRPAEVGSELDIQRTAELTQRMQNVEGYLDAQEVIDGLDDLISGIDAELESTDSKVRQKSLDREREDLFIERGEALVARSNAAAVANKQTYSERRQLLLRALKPENSGAPNPEALALLQTHFATEQQRADAAMQKADALRSANVKTRDFVKKGDAYQEALALELEAIAIQERLLKLDEASEQLISADAEVINRITKGSPAILTTTDAPSIALETTDPADEEEGTQIADADVLAGADEQAESETNTSVSEGSDATTDAIADATDVITSEEDVAAVGAPQGSDNAEEVEASEPIETETLANATGDETANASAAEAESDEADQADADEVEEATASLPDAETIEARAARVRDLRAEVALPANNASLLELPSARESGLAEASVREAEAERNDRVETRNAIVRDLNALTARIAILEQAVINASTEAEADGLAEELGVLYRSAEIRYVELAEAEAAIAASDATIAAAVDAANANASSAELAAVAAPENRSSAAGENPVTDAEAVREEAIRASESNATKPDYYFVLPEAIIESFFEVKSESVYTAEKPIPVDAPMPEGLVYKVQVGAYRKPIPQDLFKGFAPLRGEKLQNGITRYTAGVFVGFNDADDAKNSIRQLGYRDAFVVAYYNGKRISLTEARERGSDAGTLAAANTGSTAARTNTATSAVSTTAEPRNARPERPASAATENTTAAALPAFANNWSSSTGVWLTVQVGVYSRPVTLADLYNVSNVLAEQLDGKRIRYTSGKFNNLAEAQRARDAARAAGIADAFLTAYVNGRRVPVAEALEQLGNAPAQPAQPRQQTVASPPEPATQVAAAGYRVRIGAFSGQVPAATVTALLSLESTWDIEQQETANGIVFYTRSLASRPEAERALNDFLQYGVVAVTIEEVRP